MIGSSTERDPELPALGGDPELCLPSAEVFTELARRRLALPEGPFPTGATLLFARWKPGASLTTAWELRLSDGGTALAAEKRFKNGKAQRLAARTRLDARLGELCRPLAPRQIDTGAGSHLWTFPADRVLSGLPRLLDRGRTKRWIQAAGLVPAGSLHRRGIRAELLRYKPERRSVWCLELQLDGQSEPRRLAARVLPPDEAARVAAARAAFAAFSASDLAPALLAAETERGLLLEEWCRVETAAPQDFGWAEAAGRLLARLHAAPLPAGVPAAPLVELAELPPLFSVDPDLVRLAQQVAEPPRSACRSWIHGDLHPDQVAREVEAPGLGREAGAYRLLDLDRLGAGDPLRDLANWIADQVARAPALELGQAAEPLLAGYRQGGGLVPARAELAQHVAAALVRRAAASLRRLERGALEHARSALERARELAPRREALR